MKKMWAGRFEKNLNKKVDDFNSSLHFDMRMYQEDIIGSIAHVEMLAEQGIISNEDSKKIKNGLIEILDEINNGKLEIKDAEDIHMFVEAKLIEKLGEVGKKLHTARSRNDQVALDIKLYLKKEITLIKKELIQLIEKTLKIAEDNKTSVMPGYTHLQRAQPITFAHHLLAYCFMFLRDTERLDDTYKRMDYSPLGACALAGTTYPINRVNVAKKLEFEGVVLNSLDAVSDRDYVIELASNISVIMMHLSRFSEEVILWSTSEFKYIELDDAYSTGSSIMPQKKNPDVAELVRGKSGRSFGNLMALLTVFKGLPLAYNKDMQEDKEAIFDSIDTVKMCLSVFGDMLASIKVNKDKMKEAASSGFMNATDVADYLTKKGLAFRESYEVAGKLVAEAIKSKYTFESMPLDVYKKFSNKFEDDIYKVVDIEKCAFSRNSLGGPAVKEVEKQIEYIKKEIKKNEV
ncbi:MAG: argininosuccinate lyase [Bacilli bacterium]|jgi:argininosuccinate lyase